MREITPQELEQPIQQMEMHAAIRRLLFHLGGHPDTRYTLGRYHILANVIKSHPELHAALLSESDVQIQGAWWEALHSAANDIRFMHGLAVIYQEMAQANLAQPDDKLNDSVKIGTALWALLLCTPDFWSYFSPARIASTDSKREALTVQQQNELLTTTLEDLFSWHSREGKKALAAGSSDRAHLHLFCLDICRKGDKALKHLLDSQHIPYQFALNSQQIGQMTKLAGQYLDAWCDFLLEEAKCIVTDPKEIEKLPAGVRSNYQGGIAYLEPFIELNIPVASVLLASLTYSNTWASDIHRELDRQYQGSIVPFSALRPAISSIVHAAIPTADQLAALFVKDKGSAFKPEVQAIGTHLYYRAIIAENGERAIKICDEALSWEPGSDWHQRLRQEFYREIFYKQYDDKIRASIEYRRATTLELLRKADAFLERIEKDPTLQDLTREVRPVLAYYDACALAMDRLRPEALVRAYEALTLALDSDQPELVSAIRSLILSLGPPLT